MPPFKLISDKLEKPDLDDRSYRLIELDNKLTALLINDPTTDKSAASLDVNVGSFGDAKFKIPGLAHFCEHLLFMGTSKYPKENEYSSYLSQHSGHSNAYTAAERTNYYFEINHSSLEGALDRFSQFFISPLFSKDCKDREIKAVDSENKKNLQNDLWRFSQLDKATANPNHPYSGFSTGNFHTLNDEPIERGLDVRDELIKFYNESYSSNIMKLVILGKEDLDTLQKWTVEKFSDIKNSNLPIPAYDCLPYTHKEMKKIIKAKPIMDTRTMELNFLIPDQQENWDTRPASYFSHLLGHEGPGSLLFYLKQKGWCNELGTGSMSICNGSSLFMAELDLTPEGMTNWETIVINIFQYIKLMTETEPQQWLWEEMAMLSKMNFKFKQKSGASSTVSKLSSNLHKEFLPMEFLLSESVLRKWNPSKIKEFAAYLNLDNFRMSLSGRDFTGLNLKEHWYGTEYSIDDAPLELLAKIRGCGLNEKLSLPIHNEFLPEDLSVDKFTTNEPSKHPFLIENSKTSRVWFKKDDQFGVPKATVEAMLHLPISNKTPAQSVMTALFTYLLEDELNEIVYYAQIAGLHFQVSHYRDGITVKLSGYNDKLSVLLEKVLDRLLNFTPKRDRFNVFKDKIIQDYENFGYSVPYSQMGSHVLTLLNGDTYSHEQRLDVLKFIDYDLLVNFLPLIWQDHFKEITIHGNFDLAKAKNISKIINDKFSHVAPISDLYSIKPRSHTLPIGRTFRYETLLGDPKNVNSCIEYFIQLSDDYADEHKFVLAELLATVVNEPCFNQLRTKEQLGYVVFSGIRITRTTFGFKILIQSERTTEYLEFRIEEFLNKFGNYVNDDLSDEDFEKFKEALISKKSQKVKNLNEEFNRYWSSITSGYYDFEYRFSNIEVIKTITKEQFISFYNNFILNKDKTGRLIVHLKSQNPPVQSHDKLIQASIANYLTENDYTYSNDLVSGLIIKYKDDITEGNSLSNMLGELVDGLIAIKSETTEEPINDISNPSAFKTNLFEVINRDLRNPTPSVYPGGEFITSIGQFKSMVPLGGAAKPIHDISKYWHKDIAIDNEAKL